MKTTWHKTSQKSLHLPVGGQGLTERRPDGSVGLLHFPFPVSDGLLFLGVRPNSRPIPASPGSPLGVNTTSSGCGQQGRLATRSTPVSRDARTICHLWLGCLVFYMGGHLGHSPQTFYTDGPSELLSMLLQTGQPWPASQRYHLSLPETEHLRRVGWQNKPACDSGKANSFESLARPAWL